MKWYATWPTQKVFTPFQFAKHRARLIGEFKTAIEITGGILIDYENLTSGDYDFTKINQYCGIKVKEQTLDKKIGSGKDNIRKSFNINLFERCLLDMGDRYGKK